MTTNYIFIAIKKNKRTIHIVIFKKCDIFRIPSQKNHNGLVDILGYSLYCTFRSRYPDRLNLYSCGPQNFFVVVSYES